VTKLNFDYETKSEIDLKVSGLDLYSAHPSTRVMLCSYSFDDDEAVELWDYNDGKPFPRDVRKALADPTVEKRAFNAQFERVITNRVLKIDSPVKNWRCTMVRAYLLSFSKSLEDVGYQMGLPVDKLKMAEGKKLIQLFCKPQRVTKNQPFRWRDALTDPELWEIFREYCRRDTVSEKHILKKLEPYYIPADEWDLYELDQRINDRGLPIDMQFVNNAIILYGERKAQLMEEMRDVTGLANPNSGTQLLPWLQQRGYPFSDLQKDTVRKVLRESVDSMDAEAIKALRLRLNANRQSLAKYPSLKAAVGHDGETPTFRFGFQMAGAQRTARWGGRRFQPHNLMRTPKELEHDSTLSLATEFIRDLDAEGLQLVVGEPMTALTGCMRSAIRAANNRQLRVADLSSIETCVVAWLSNCTRLLQVIRSGLDAYKDFAVILYRGCYAQPGTPEYVAAYESITKTERNNSKPAVLGACYRLGGGDLVAGKKTGLWGYAENMGIMISKEESHKGVTAYRENYDQVPTIWVEYERAIAKCLSTGNDQKVGPVTFRYTKPFLLAILPTGRPLYYFKPLMKEKIFTKVVGYSERDGEIVESWKKKSFSYMGQNQKSGKWERVFSHGGKVLENITQAFARDILKYGMLDADEDGFNIRLHVHDEIGADEEIEDDYHTIERLGAHMTRARDFAPGLPLGWAGWNGPFYRKD
jgi:DNA polymerase